MKIKDTLLSVLVLIVIYAAIFFFIDVISESEQSVYYRGYDEGYEKGRISGYSEGYDEGNFSGYENGYEDGYDMGIGDGYWDGHKEGYDEGYEDAKTEGTLDEQPRTEWPKIEKTKDTEIGNQ